MPWDPFREMAPFWPGEDQPVHFAPEFEVKETQDAFVFKADLPGIKEKDLEITMTGNRLTISGKREAEKEQNTDVYYARECSYGGFTRAFTLPSTVDTSNVKADYKDGVLRITLPKREEAKPKQIEVKVK